MKKRDYQITDQDALIRILRMNVPKYFSEMDVHDFQEYLCQKQWDKHFTYLDDAGRVVGCASCWVKSRGVISLSWMFFEPRQVGSAVVVSQLKEYFSAVAKDLSPQADPILIFNTTPQVAKFMRRLGFRVTEVVKDGYWKGYDKVSMEMIWEATEDA